MRSSLRCATRFAPQAPTARAGRSEQGHVALAHRRLAVVDLTAEASQPMLAYDRQGSVAAAVVYNDELYNDAELQAHARKRAGRVAAPAGQGARSLRHAERHGDQLALLSQAARVHIGAAPAKLMRGPMRSPVLATMRGMFALGFPGFSGSAAGDRPRFLGIAAVLQRDRRRSRAGERTRVRASRRCGRSGASRTARPDLVTVSSLTTIRTTLESARCFSGVHAPPGEMAVIDLRTRARSGGSARLDSAAARREEPVGVERPRTCSGPVARPRSHPARAGRFG